MAALVAPEDALFDARRVGNQSGHPHFSAALGAPVALGDFARLARNIGS